MNFMGEFEQALVSVQKARDLDPRSGIYLTAEGFAYQGVGRYEDAMTAFKHHLTLHPGFFIDHLGLAVDYVELGRADQPAQRRQRF